MSDQTKAAALTIAAQIVEPAEDDTPQKRANRIARVGARLVRQLDLELAALEEKAREKAGGSF